MESLYEKLKAYEGSDFYGFHMPGHKQDPTLTGADLPYGIDITEIDGFDDLHHPKEEIKEMEELASALYQAEESHLLINGSTVGVISAILGSTCPGDRILMARNCHRSVYHAVELQKLNPVYLYPDMDQETDLNEPVKAEEVARVLRQDRKDTAAKGDRIQEVIITSPTYDGVFSDIQAIAEVAHDYGIPLIVDEAHGAHFGFHSEFPENANTLGADVVIHSLHKTLPALTQTGLIHINQDIVDHQKICRYLDMLQSSSPSYILMAGIDVCLQLLRDRGNELFSDYVQRLNQAREELSGLQQLHLVDREDMDPSKLVISTKGTLVNGRWLSDELIQKYHIQPEMAAGSYVLALSSVADTKEGFDRLTQALLAIDSEIKETEPLSQMSQDPYPRLEQVMPSWTALEKHGKEKSWEQSEGEVALEYAYLYPPGIPLIVPGERISGEVRDLIQRYQEMGYHIEGPKEDDKIEVLMDE